MNAPSLEKICIQILLKVVKSILMQVYIYHNKVGLGQFGSGFSFGFIEFGLGRFQGKENQLIRFRRLRTTLTRLFLGGFREIASSATLDYDV